MWHCIVEKSLVKSHLHSKEISWHDLYMMSRDGDSSDKTDNNGYKKLLYGCDKTDNNGYKKLLYGYDVMVTILFLQQVS